MNNDFIRVDQSQLEKITKALDGISYKAPTVLKNAANTAGKAVERMVNEQSGQMYTNPKKPSEFLKRKRATYANPARILEYRQQGANSLFESEVSPHFPEPWTDPISWAIARVRADSSPGHVVKYGHKGFVAMMKNGHLGVFVRKEGSSKDIEQVKSPAVPFMAGKSYDEVEDEAGSLLQKELDKEIKKVMDFIHG